MKDGFIKVAAITPEIRVADCIFNANEIVKNANKAYEKGARVIVFPELSVTGYTCGDLFLQQTLLQGAKEQVEKIARQTADMDALIIVGAPLKVGVKLTNCAIAIKSGKVLAIVPKHNIPNYTEFYEKRYFAEADEIEKNATVFIAGQYSEVNPYTVLRCKELPELAIGIEICEDLWVNNSPSSVLCSQGATVICNLSASDETIGKADYRRLLVKGVSGRGICGYIYCDAGSGESTTDLVFAGHNIIAENGSIINENKPFEEGITISEIDVKKLACERLKQNTFNSCDCEHEVYFSLELSETELTRYVDPNPFVPADTNHINERCEEILNIQAVALAKRIKHTNCKSLVVGLSGGLDSALALLVMYKAIEKLGLPKRTITAVTMPCFGTTKRTKSNAQKLAEGLGVNFIKVDITKSVLKHFEDIGHDGVTTDVTYENCQARERTQVLMDIANKTGGIVVGTGDLSELALGWATYNGDHMSMYGVNASIPKTLVRHLVRYYADQSETVKVKKALTDILDTPVSPELIPAKDGEIVQKTEEIVGPYELHDFFLYYAVRWGFAPSKIYRLAKYAVGDKFSEQTIYKWLEKFYSRFFAQQFKRSCLPDGPKVGSVDLSPRGGWRMPSDACKTLWLEDLKKCKK